MKIGIIRIDRMGDMILTLPIIQSIKSIDSSIKIHVFASSRNVQVIKSFKYIDRIFNINDENKLNKEKYDLILNFSPGWKSFFLCLFSKASKKGNLIFLSRYKKKYYSKLLFLILSKIFFQKTLIINRIKRFNNNQSIHCTEMMFKLLDKCDVTYEKNLLIENFLPKFKVIASEKKICLVHLSARWINNYYAESDFLNLILKLQSKFNLALTTDDSTKEKFNLIFKRYPIINNYQFDHFKTLNEVVIFENLNFKNWTQIIHSSNLVITPECGLIHVAAACKIPFKIIYDPNNKPDMMYKEYTPLKSKHERFLFNDKNLNSLLTQKDIRNNYLKDGIINKIDIILPYKEIFSKKKASAVSITIINSCEFSKFKSSIKVFGQFTKTPFKDINFVGLKIKRLLHFGNNRSILVNYLNLHKKNTSSRKIIEFHNRPYLFNFAIRILRNTPKSLHFHNDPTEMRGSKTISERMRIAKNADAVYFVSEFIKKRFLDGLSMDFNNLHVLSNGVERKLHKQPKKNKEVAFVGRIVQEKGVHIFVQSIRSLVKKYPEWKFRIIGTSKAGNEKLETNYEKKVIRDFKALGHNAEYSGFIPNSEVKEIMRTLSILVVPSIWEEPLGLTALEGFCYGAAIIASKVGGLKEMLDGTGLLIEDIDEIKLEKSIASLIQNNKLMQDYQNKSWINYKYNQSQIVKKQDRIRNEIFNSYYL